MLVATKEGTSLVAEVPRSQVHQNLFRLLARSTQSLRRALGLVGYKVKMAKRNQPQMAHRSQGKIQLDALTRELSDTYHYLNTLLEDSQIKPNDPF